jgi:hypothetical protein
LNDAVGAQLVGLRKWLVAQARQRQSRFIGFASWPRFMRDGLVVVRNGGVGDPTAALLWLRRVAQRVDRRAKVQRC